MCWASRRLKGCRMDTRKKAVFAWVWSLIWPLLLYEILSGTVALVTGYFFSLSLMGTTLVANLAEIPVFGRIYARDFCRREEGSLFLEMPDTYLLIWTVTGSAALAVLCNVAISMTPLTEWSGAYREMAVAMNGDGMVLRLIVSVLAAPAAEELVMRGVFYKRIRQRLPAGTSIVCSGLVFGIFHGNLVQGVYAFIMGMFFAGVMERFGTVMVPVLAHMSANLVILFLSEGDNAARMFGTGSSFLLEMVVCIACAVRTIQLLKSREN